MYPDTISVPLSRAELDLVGQRISASTREELERAATEGPPGTFAVEVTEERARDLMAKAANLGLVSLASRLRQELDALTSQRRRR